MPNARWFHAFPGKVIASTLGVAASVIALVAYSPHALFCGPCVWKAFGGSGEMESGDPTMWNFDHGATWSLASGGASEAAELPLGAASACRLVQCEASGLRRTACPTVSIAWFSSLLWLFCGCSVTVFCGCGCLSATDCRCVLCTACRHGCFAMVAFGFCRCGGCCLWHSVHP